MRYTAPSLSATSHSSRSQGSSERSLSRSERFPTSSYASTRTASTTPPTSATGRRTASRRRRQSRGDRSSRARAGRRRPPRARARAGGSGARRCTTACRDGRAGRTGRPSIATLRLPRACDPAPSSCAVANGLIANAPGRYESTTRRRADAILPHQRAEPREQRRELLGRRMRAREQRVLQHAARRRIDHDRHAIDGAPAADATRDRAAPASAASARRASATAARSRRAHASRCVTSRERARAAPRRRDRAARDAWTAARAAASARTTAARAPRSATRARATRSKRSSGSVGTSGRDVLAARDRLPGAAPAAEPRRRSAAGKRRQLAERANPPRFEHAQDSRRSFTCVEIPCASDSCSAIDAVGIVEVENPDRQSARARRLRRRVDDREARTRAARARGPPSACRRRPRARAGRATRASRRSSSPIVARGARAAARARDVDRHEIVAVPLVARREIARRDAPARPR